MSAIVHTLTPFTSKELLLEALNILNIKYHLSENSIITDRVDYYGHQTFVLLNERYQFKHDSSADVGSRFRTYPWGTINFKEWKTASEFLNAVETEYNKAYGRMIERLAEEERIKEEERKRELVEQQRKSIISKAKEKGYSIKEIKKDKGVQLVLTRTIH